MRFTSSAVMTLSTPAGARAALVSMLLMRPWPTVARKLVPYSICGSRRLCTYSARPVTLSHDSSGGTERPTCAVSAECVARFIDRPLQINSRQVFLVVRRTVQIVVDGDFARRLGRLLEERPGDRLAA